MCSCFCTQILSRGRNFCRNTKKSWPKSGNKWLAVVSRGLFSRSTLSVVHLPSRWNLLRWHTFSQFVGCACTHRFDVAQAGVVDYEDFCEMLQSERYGLSEEQASLAFQVIDAEREGFVTYRDIELFVGPQPWQQKRSQRYKRLKKHRRRKKKKKKAEALKGQSWMGNQDPATSNPVRDGQDVSRAFPKLLEVAGDGTKDFMNVQDAIDYAEVFEKEFQQRCCVSVHPGIYYENLCIRTAVRLQSAPGSGKPSRESEVSAARALAGEVVIAGSKSTSRRASSSSQRLGKGSGSRRKRRPKRRKARKVSSAPAQPIPRVGAVVKVKMSSDIWGPLPAASAGAEEENEEGAQSTIGSSDFDEDSSCNDILFIDSIMTPGQERVSRWRAEVGQHLGSGTFGVVEARAVAHRSDDTSDVDSAHDEDQENDSIQDSGGGQASRLEFLSEPKRYTKGPRPDARPFVDRGTFPTPPPRPKTTRGRRKHDKLHLKSVYGETKKAPNTSWCGPNRRPHTADATTKSVKRASVGNTARRGEGFGTGRDDDPANTLFMRRAPPPSQTKSKRAQALTKPRPQRNSVPRPVARRHHKVVAEARTRTRDMAARRIQRVERHRQKTWNEFRAWAARSNLETCDGVVTKVNRDGSCAVAFLVEGLAGLTATTEAGVESSTEDVQTILHRVLPSAIESSAVDKPDERDDERALLHLCKGGALFAEVDGIVFHNRSRENGAVIAVDGAGNRPQLPNSAGRTKTSGLTIRTMMGNGRKRTEEEEHAMLQGGLEPEDTPAVGSSTKGNGCSIFRCQCIGVGFNIVNGASPTVARCAISAPLSCAMRVHGVGSDPDIRFNTITWVRPIARPSVPLTFILQLTWCGLCFLGGRECN